MEHLLNFCQTDTQRTYVQAVIDHGSCRKAAKALGKAKSTITESLQRLQARAAQAGVGDQYLKQDVVPPGFAVSKVSSYVNQEGETTGQWVQSKPGAQDKLESVKEWARWLSEDFKGKAPAKFRTTHTDADIMCVYPMGDPHFGLYSWGEETGEDFDLEEAERRTIKVIDRLVASAPASETALFINLGDMLHADDSTNRTPASGHALDVDTRFGKVVQVALRAMIYCIEAMRQKHKKVIYWHEIANHDPHSGYMLALCLSAYYDKAKDVEINLSPSFFHYMQFGKCLIGATHGHGPKQQDLPLIMAHDQKEAWGKTDYRYWYVGHVHHKSAKEHPGVIVETFRTLTGTDAWHSSKGYRSGQDMNVITLHKEHGEIQRTTCPLGMIDA